MGTRSEKRQADVFPNKIDVAARIPQTDTVPPESAGVETMRSLFLAVAPFAVLDFRRRLVLPRSAIEATAAASKSAVTTPINCDTTLFFDRQ